MAGHQGQQLGSKHAYEAEESEDKLELVNNNPKHMKSMTCITCRRRAVLCHGAAKVPGPG